MDRQDSLYNAVCATGNLQQAWAAVRSGRTIAARGHGAGVDGVTIAEWEQYWPERLVALQQELQRGTYQPSPLLSFEIPRAEAGRTRRLGIPTVTDRVAQRAVKNVLEAVWEPVFLPCSHGFRPNRSVYTAVAYVLWHQSHGLDWVVDADIESCFESVAHSLLLADLEALGDARLLELIAMWLAVGACSPGCGLAQGAVLSPLLANIYLHPFDVAMVEAGWSLVRYADDLVVLSASAEEAEHALYAMVQVLAQREMTVNWAKADILPFGPQFRFLGAQFIG